MGRDDLAGKPDKMKEKIVDGRIGKRTQGAGPCWINPFIKDSSITVAELVKQVAGKTRWKNSRFRLHRLHPRRKA